MHIQHFLKKLVPLYFLNSEKISFLVVFTSVKVVFSTSEKISVIFTSEKHHFYFRYFSIFHW